MASQTLTQRWLIKLTRCIKSTNPSRKRHLTEMQHRKSPLPARKNHLKSQWYQRKNKSPHRTTHTPQGGAPFTHRKVPEPAPYNSVNVVRYRVHAPAPARLQFPIDAEAPPAVLHNPVSPRPGGRVAESLSRGACWERPKSPATDDGGGGHLRPAEPRLFPSRRGALHLRSTTSHTARAKKVVGDCGVK